jgi:hypothetical protein
MYKLKCTVSNVMKTDLRHSNKDTSLLNRPCILLRLLHPSLGAVVYSGGAVARLVIAFGLKAYGLN